MRMKRCLLLGGILLVLTARPAGTAGGPQGVAVRVFKGHVDFLTGGQLAGRYHYNDEWSKAKPILWPLYAKGGIPVTRAWPMEPAAAKGSKDHPHQKSAWFCHGDVIPEGIEIKDKVRGVEGVDFWSETRGHGRIVCTSVGEPRTKGDQGSLVTKNEWRTADGTKILDETRTIRLYELDKARLFVFDIDLTASVCPITFGDTKEGAMGVRVNDVLREQGGNGKLTNADGKTHEREVWGRKSAWCDYSGTINGQEAGIALFDDPQNPYPALWHARGYGLMAANPFGRARSGFPGARGRRGLVWLPRGHNLRLRYGILVHDGDAATAHVADLYRQFVRLRGEEKSGR